MSGLIHSLRKQRDQLVVQVVSLEADCSELALYRAMVNKLPKDSDGKPDFARIAELEARPAEDEVYEVVSYAICECGANCYVETYVIAVKEAIRTLFAKVTLVTKHSTPKEKPNDHQQSQPSPTDPLPS